MGSGHDGWGWVGGGDPGVLTLIRYAAHGGTGLWGHRVTADVNPWEKRVLVLGQGEGKLRGVGLFSLCLNIDWPLRVFSSSTNLLALARVP